MSRSARCVGVVDAYHDPLEVRSDVGGHLDPQRCRGFDRSSDAAGEAGRAGVALEHVVPGQDIDRTIPVGRQGTVHHGHQVAPRQRVHLSELGLQHLCRDCLVDPGSAEQRGHEVDV